MPLWYSILCVIIYHRGESMSDILEYVFVSLPEMFFTMVLAFAIFGIPIRSKMSRLVLFAATSSAFTALGDIYFGASSLKVIVLTPLIFALTYLIFRYKFTYTLLILLGAIFTLGWIQLCLMVSWSNVAGVPIDELVQPLSNKVIACILTSIVQVSVAYILIQKNWQFKLQGIER